MFTQVSCRFSVHLAAPTVLQICILSVICFVSALASGLWDESRGQDSWYLQAEDDVAGEAIKTYFTFLILYYHMVPISLYIRWVLDPGSRSLSTALHGDHSVELSRLLQSLFIERDKHMYYKPLDMYAQARTSGLNEELGQVEATRPALRLHWLR